MPMDPITGTLVSTAISTVLGKLFGGSSNRDRTANYNQERVANAEANTIEQKQRLMGLLQRMITDMPARNGPAFRLPRETGQGSNLEEVLASIDFGANSKLQRLMQLYSATGTNSATVNSMAATAQDNASASQDYLGSLAQDLAKALLNKGTSIAPVTTPGASNPDPSNSFGGWTGGWR